MARCNVCVELEGAEQPAYADLHRMLLGAGLRETIAANSKAEYRLPAGVYCYEGKLDQDALRDSLDVVVGSIGLPYGLLITTGKSVWNLLQVKDAPPLDQGGTGGEKRSQTS